MVCFAKRIIGFVLFLVISASAHPAIQQAWIAKYSGGVTKGTNEAVAVAVDLWGNVVVSGTSTSFGNPDYVTIKYLPNGTQLWVKRYSSAAPSDDHLRAMALDKDGNVWVTGTSRTIKYDHDGTQVWTAPYAGWALAVDTSSNVYVTGFSEVDYATVKLDSAGSNVWTRTYDQVGCNDVAQAITVDPFGSTYVAGISQFICQGPQSTYARWVLVKYDTNGVQLWATNSGEFQLGRSSLIKGIAYQSGDGAVVLTGNSDGAPHTFDTSRYDHGGNPLWSYYLDATDYTSGVGGMQVDAAGYIYLGGSSTSVIGPQIATIKLSSAGTNIWIAQHGSYGWHAANAIALDGNGNVYVTGISTPSGYPFDIATLKYDNDGHQLWVQRYDGPFHGDDQAAAIAVDSSGGVYVAGYSQTSSNLIELTVIKYAELQNAQLLPNGHALLQFFGTPGQSYRFQASSTLTNWVDLGSSVADTNGIYRLEDTNAPAYPSRFYRTVSP